MASYILLFNNTWIFREVKLFLIILTEDLIKIISFNIW